MAETHGSSGGYSPASPEREDCSRGKLRYGIDYYACYTCRDVGVLGRTGGIAENKQLGVKRCSCGSYFCAPHHEDAWSCNVRRCFEKHAQEDCTDAETRATWSEYKCSECEHERGRSGYGCIECDVRLCKTCYSEHREMCSAPTTAREIQAESQRFSIPSLGWGQ